MAPNEPTARRSFRGTLKKAFRLESLSTSSNPATGKRATIKDMFRPDKSKADPSSNKRDTIKKVFKALINMPSSDSEGVRGDTATDTVAKRGLTMRWKKRPADKIQQTFTLLSKEGPAISDHVDHNSADIPGQDQSPVIHAMIINPRVRQLRAFSEAEAAPVIPTIFIHAAPTAPAVTDFPVIPDVPAVADVPTYIDSKSSTATESDRNTSTGTNVTSATTATLATSISTNITAATIATSATTNSIGSSYSDVDLPVLLLAPANSLAVTGENSPVADTSSIPEGSFANSLSSRLSAVLSNAPVLESGGDLPREYYAIVYSIFGTFQADDDKGSAAEQDEQAVNKAPRSAEGNKRMDDDAYGLHVFNSILLGPIDDNLTHHQATGPFCGTDKVKSEEMAREQVVTNNEALIDSQDTTSSSVYSQDDALLKPGVAPVEDFTQDLQLPLSVLSLGSDDESNKSDPDPTLSVVPGEEKPSDIGSVSDRGKAADVNNVNITNVDDVVKNDLPTQAKYDLTIFSEDGTDKEGPNSVDQCIGCLWPASSFETETQTGSKSVHVPQEAEGQTRTERTDDPNAAIGAKHPGETRSDGLGQKTAAAGAIARGPVAHYSYPGVVHLSSNTTLYQHSSSSSDQYDLLDASTNSPGRRGSSDHLAPSSWGLFKKRSTVDYGIGPDIMVTDTEGYSLWPDDLTYYPDADHWSDLDSDSSGLDAVAS